MVVRSVCAHQYKTTELALQMAFHMRTELGDDFEKILNLGRNWAGIRWVRSQAIQLEIRPDNLEKWYKETVDSFIDGTITSEAVALTEIAQKAVGMLKKVFLKYQAKHKDDAETAFLAQRPATDRSTGTLSWQNPGLDWQVIQALYAWLPPLVEAINKTERAFWIAQTIELTDIETTYLKSISRGHRDEISGTPYDFERWIFDLAAKQIPQLESSERPEMLWQPILDLGPEYHYWIDDFLTSWLMEGISTNKDPERFFQHWGHMIEYSLTSPQWEYGSKVSKYYYLGDLQINLMGLKYGAHTQERYKEHISAMLPMFERWASSWLKLSRVFNAFARFLKEPSASDLTVPGLSWLAQASGDISDYGWESSGISDSLLPLLLECWTDRRSELDTNSDFKNSYLLLLNLLVQKQEPGAMELLDQMTNPN